MLYLMVRAVVIAEILSMFLISYVYMTDHAVAWCRANHGRYNLLAQTCMYPKKPVLIIPKPQVVI